jgi:general secretion pathway protein H
MISSNSPALTPRQGVAGAGFTLLELLVVLAIMTLMIVVAPRLVGGSAGLQVRAAATGLAADVRLLRQLAISQHVTTQLVLGTHGYTLQPAGVVRMLPTNLVLHLDSEVPDLLGTFASVLRFFPDGSSTGGIVAIRVGNVGGYVRIRWLDGSVMVDAA